MKRKRLKKTYICLCIHYIPNQINCIFLFITLELFMLHHSEGTTVQSKYAQKVHSNRIFIEMRLSIL